MYARPDSSASTASSSSTPAALASSGIVGERPSCTVSCSMSRDSWTLSSCSPRGTRTDQPLSRKCRLISPMMFGVAYVVSSTPRSRSKRSIALISPIAPIWTRSSSCSPRYGVAPRERADERHVLLDQLLPRLEIAVLVVAAEEDLVVDPRHRSLLWPLRPSSSARPRRRRRAPRTAACRRRCRGRGAGRVPRPTSAAVQQLRRERPDRGVQHAVVGREDTTSSSGSSRSASSASIPTCRSSRSS